MRPPTWITGRKASAHLSGLRPRCGIGRRWRGGVARLRSRSTAFTVGVNARWLGSRRDAGSDGAGAAALAVYRSRGRSARRAATSGQRILAERRCLRPPVETGLSAWAERGDLPDDCGGSEGVRLWLRAVMRERAVRSQARLGVGDACARMGQWWRGVSYRQEMPERRGAAVIARWREATFDGPFS